MPQSAHTSVNRGLRSTVTMDGYEVRPRQRGQLRVVSGVRVSSVVMCRRPVLGVVVTRVGSLEPCNEPNRSS